MKTIRQLANEIGVSKTAINKEITALNLRHTLQMEGNQFQIGPEAEAMIKDAFAKRARPHDPTRQRAQATNQYASPAPEASSQTDTQPFSEVVGVLQTTISALERQLEVKDQQIEQQARTISRLSDSLVAAQTLHAETIKAQLLPAPVEEARAAESEPESAAEAPRRGFFARLFGKS